LQYHIYNAILRQYPTDIYQTFRDGNNLFTTTIHVLVSALQKISRVMKMEKEMTLYRGLGWDADLPELFFRTDDHGCSGFTEWGFMSTTSRKEVAIEYSRVQEGNPLPRVLIINTGSIDRGACIKEFSQYEAEVEYLYVPCSFLEQCGPKQVEATDHGVVEMIPVRVNANLKTKTIEELVDQKKNTHMAAFEYVIHEIDRELHSTAETENAQQRLLNDESRDKGPEVVEGAQVNTFLDRIVGQCKDVMAKHQATSSSDYVNDGIFRSLVMEMINVKAMAVSKLKEWLKNTKSSFIRFRWNSPLRTAHRRYIAFLERRLLNCPDADKKAASLELCKITGLIAESVQERNELEETALMSMAAAGSSMKTLKLMVDAGADTNECRPDGVFPLWLAAQFGHAWCIRSLVELKANTNRAANDGATPVYIAAQSGNSDCIEVLAELRADVLLADKKGMAPVHEAAMNGNEKCIKVLFNLKADLTVRNASGLTPLALAKKNKHTECARAISDLISDGGTEVSRSPLVTMRKNSVETDGTTSIPIQKLIISTGDISDIDGFFALAEYAKTGADVLFIMNYPAYVGVSPQDVDPKYAEANPGLGYKYSAREVFAKVSSPEPEKYKQFLDSCRARLSNAHEQGSVDDNELMKAALTDLAFCMATEVFYEGGPKGKLLFCIGGINSINPFSASAIKNEVLVYAESLLTVETGLPTQQGLIFNKERGLVALDMAGYSEIYMDFNGSLSFWDDSWVDRLSSSVVAPRIKGVFIMGGVLTDAQPVTMPPIPNILNRFSSATMNQLYHPQKAADFFSFLDQFKIPCFIVTNNVIGDLSTFADAEKKQKTNEGIESFLASNELGGKFLKTVALAHYNSRYNPPRKPFDFYTALALRSCLIENEKNAIGEEPAPFATMQKKCSQKSLMPSKGPDEENFKFIYYSNAYGITCVSRKDTWEAAQQEYMAQIGATLTGGDAFTISKREYFQKEMEIMKKIGRAARLRAFDLRFDLDEATKKLTLKLPSASHALSAQPSA
jgi:hypothetical protein